MYFTSGGASSLCVKLDQQIFSTDEFLKYARQNLVLMKLDFTKQTVLAKDLQKQNDDLAKKYEADKFPTVVVLDADGKQVGKLTYQARRAGPVHRKSPQTRHGRRRQTNRRVNPAAIRCFQSARAALERITKLTKSTKTISFSSLWSWWSL